jgi:catechol 2,3-dioxygenase-like lactoylglutathione lyase family enzyme
LPHERSIRDEKAVNGSKVVSRPIVISGIHHVQITIPSGAELEARRFYAELLGLKEIAKPTSLVARGGFWLQAGELQVHVGVEDGMNRAVTKAHIAYTVDGLAVWRGRLVAAGIEILEGIPIPGYGRFEFRDPFGNRIEFIEREKP